jgi:hypothetical protein
MKLSDAYALAGVENVSTQFVLTVDRKGGLHDQSRLLYPTPQPHRYASR